MITIIITVTSNLTYSIYDRSGRNIWKSIPNTQNRRPPEVASDGQLEYPIRCPWPAGVLVFGIPNIRQGVKKCWNGIPTRQAPWFWNPRDESAPLHLPPLFQQISLIQHQLCSLHPRFSLLSLLVSLVCQCLSHCLTFSGLTRPW